MLMVHIVVFYPAEGVSHTGTSDDNSRGKMSMCGVIGNFDDAQTGVKLYLQIEFNRVIKTQDIGCHRQIL